MYSLNLIFKQKTKKLTLPKTLNSQDFYKLIGQSFRLKQKVIGLTNQKGQLINFQLLQKNPSLYEKDKLYLIVTQDMNDDNMSFASDHGQYKNENSYKQQKRKIKQTQQIAIPQKLEGYYQGVIGDLQLFEELFLQQKQVTIVFCFIKQKPKNFMFPYYLYHTAKNSAIIYYGSNRLCEFFIETMQQIPKSIQTFIRSVIPQKVSSQKQIYEKGLGKNSKAASSKVSSKQSQQKFSLNQQNEKQLLFQQEDKLIALNEQQHSQLDNDNQDQQANDNQQENDSDEQDNGNQQDNINQQTEQTQIQTSLLQNLLKLRDDGEITQLEFYKMKSQLLQNLSDFMRKYQMGTRNGVRKNRFIEENKHQQFSQDNKINKRNNLKNKKPQTKLQQKPSKQFFDYRQFQKQQKQIERNTHTPQSKNVARSAISRDQRRSKRYQIPIIVRKYNNVIQKISTSYPLTQEQQQSINLILQLQLKGLISQKQSGVYKTSILQQDPEVFPLFLDYFDNLIDQLELVSKLKKIKKINSQKKQRSQHNMRLLIKYARQGSYELLRTLLLQKNHLVLGALDKFRTDKNVQRLASRLEKIAIVYRQKGQLQEDVYQ